MIECSRYLQPAQAALARFFSCFRWPLCLMYWVAFDCIDRKKHITLAQELLRQLKMDPHWHSRKCLLEGLISDHNIHYTVLLQLRAAYKVAHQPNKSVIIAAPSKSNAHVYFCMQQQLCPLSCSKQLMPRHHSMWNCTLCDHLGWTIGISLHHHIH